MKYRTGQLLPWTGPPYGFRVDPERPRDRAGVRLDEAEQVIVAQMFDRYFEARHHAILHCQAFNRPGASNTNRKAALEVSTVRGILTKSARTGVAYAQHRYPVPAGRRKSALQPAAPGVSRALRQRRNGLPSPCLL